LKLVKNFDLYDYQINEMLVNLENTFTYDQYVPVVCQWLQDNEHVWSNWIPEIPKAASKA
jgi:ABC-type proline/glycine betaine transport system substrate-binding protein